MPDPEPDHIPEETDRALVERVMAGGDPGHEAWGALMKKYEGSVHRFCFRLIANRSRADADDLCSEAWTRAHRVLANYKPDKSFSNWVKQKAWSIWGSSERKTNQPRPYGKVLAAYGKSDTDTGGWQDDDGGDPDAQLQPKSHEPDPSEDAAKNEQIDLLKSCCLQTLNPKQQQALGLRYCKHTLLEIAAKMHLSEHAVKGLIDRGLEKLKSHVRTNHKEDENE